MDLKMQIMDGYMATQLIKSMREDLPILAITAYASLENKHRALESGCDDFIIKPVSKMILFEKLAKYGIDISGQSDSESN